MSKIKNGGLDSMAKCKVLTGSAVKGLMPFNNHMCEVGKGRRLTG